MAVHASRYRLTTSSSRVCRRPTRSKRLTGGRDGRRTIHKRYRRSPSGLTADNPGRSRYVCILEATTIARHRPALSMLQGVSCVGCSYRAVVCEDMDGVVRMTQNSGVQEELLWLICTPDARMLAGCVPLAGWCHAAASSVSAMAAAATISWAGHERRIHAMADGPAGANTAGLGTGATARQRKAVASAARGF